MPKLLADEGAERAGGETRGPRFTFTPEELAERDAWLAAFAAAGFVINLMDPNDPANARETPENTEHGE